MANTIWQWFQENEATAGGVTDKIKSYMARQGYVAATNEMLYNWLKDLGYSITLNEMLAKFEEENPSMIDGFIKSEANVLSTVSSDYTFSRTGGQTGINSASQIYQAERKNLLTYSEQFEDASWLKQFSSISQNSIAAPNETITADKLIEDSSTNIHRLSKQVSSTAGFIYTLSVYLKAAGRNFAQVRYENSGSTVLYAANVNLITGEFTNGTFGSPARTITTVRSAGNGWWRVAITFESNNASISSIIYATAVQGTVTYAGDGTSGIYVWGAQLEQSPFATAYIPTTTAAVTVSDPAYISGQGILLEGARTNLLTYSRDMANAAWNRTDVTPTRNQTGADGAASSACLITCGGALTDTLFQQLTVTAGSTVTGSFIFKRGNNDWIQMLVWDNTADGYRTWVNLSSGTISGSAVIGAGTGSASISALGNGWYRVQITTTPNATYTTAKIEIRSAVSSGSNVRVSGATYIVDYAQLEVGPFASSPIETVAAAVTRNATSLSRNWTLPANNFSGQIKLRPQFARGQLVSQSIFGFSDGTANNRYVVNLSATGYLLNGKYVGGVSVFSSGATSLEFTNNQLINLRFKQDSSGMSFWVNNVPVIKTTTGVAPNDYSPVLTQLWLNQPLSGFAAGFTVFESVKIWHEAKSDEFLAALT